MALAEGGTPSWATQFAHVVRRIGMGVMKGPRFDGSEDGGKQGRGWSKNNSDRAEFPIHVLTCLSVGRCAVAHKAAKG
jgi:hypothetical protein